MRGFWQSKLQTQCPEYHAALKICVQLFALFQVQNKKLALVFVLAWYLLSHLSLLVGGIYLYSSRHISDHDYLLGKSLLEQYEQFSVLYGYNMLFTFYYFCTGVKSCSMNVHLLCHLPKYCVLMCSWITILQMRKDVGTSYSCFHFEAQNGYSFTELVILQNRY